MIKEFFRNISRVFMLIRKRGEAKHLASFDEREEKQHRHEIPTAMIGNRFGRAIERLAER